MDQCLAEVVITTIIEYMNKMTTKERGSSLARKAKIQELKER